MKNYKKILVIICIIIVFFSIMEMACYVSSRFDLGIPCMVNKIFGISCATCGMTRAIVACARLDFYQAIRYNTFSIPLILVILIAVISMIYSLVFNVKLNLFKMIPKQIWITLIVLLLLYGVIRNIGPFRFLLPINIR